MEQTSNIKYGTCIKVLEQNGPVSPGYYSVERLHSNEPYLQLIEYPDWWVPLKICKIKNFTWNKPDV